MFDIPQPRSGKRRLALLASFVIHCGLLYVWWHRPPIFVKPSSVAWGMHGQSETLVYLAPQSESRPLAKEHKLRFQPKKEDSQKKQQSSAESARAGESTGSLFQGDVTGVEARPALPLVFPDPAIFPWQLPDGLKGDVIVEITIDQYGNVTDTRILQSLKQDIDQKVISTLQGWRFKPATIDGVAIASRQDVHFHFPG